MPLIFRQLGIKFKLRVTCWNVYSYAYLIGWLVTRLFLSKLLHKEKTFSGNLWTWLPVVQTKIGYIIQGNFNLILPKHILNYIFLFLASGESKMTNSLKAYPSGTMLSSWQSVPRCYRAMMGQQCSGFCQCSGRWAQPLHRRRGQRRFRKQTASWTRRLHWTLEGRHLCPAWCWHTCWSTA